MAFSFKNPKLARRPIPGFPPDHATEWAFKDVQSAVVGLSRATAKAIANVAASALSFTTGGVQSVGSANVDGTSPYVPHLDHGHQGMHSITGPAGTRFGDVTLQGYPISQLLGVFTFYGLQSMFGIPNRVSADYQMLATDFLVFVTGGHTVTLPAANVGTDGYTVVVYNDDPANNATVAAHGVDTIAGVASKVLTKPNSGTNYCGGFFVSNGVSRWTAMFLGG